MQLLHTSALFVFWGCAALIVYAYVVYPVLLVTLGALRRAAVASDLRAAERVAREYVVFHRDELLPHMGEEETAVFPAFEAFLAGLGYRFQLDSDNEAYQRFLA